MLKDEKMKILEMLSEGIINSEQAEKLLKALDVSNQVVEVKEKVTNNTKTFKVLKIMIESSTGDDVNIKIPLEFAKVLKSKAFSSQISNSNTNIDIDEIIELASSGITGEIINIETAEGDSIKITIE